MRHISGNGPVASALTRGHTIPFKQRNEVIQAHAHACACVHVCERSVIKLCKQTHKYPSVCLARGHFAMKGYAEILHASKINFARSINLQYWLCTVHDVVHNFEGDHFWRFIFSPTGRLTNRISMICRNKETFPPFSSGCFLNNRDGHNIGIGITIIIITPYRSYNISNRHNKTKINIFSYFQSYRHEVTYNNRNYYLDYCQVYKGKINN